MEYFSLVAVGALSFVAGGLTVAKFSTQKPKVLQEKAVETKKITNTRTEERKEQIIQLIKETVENQIQLEESSGMITQKGIVRADVEELLNVSSTTARRYLKLLEEDEVIAQISEPSGDVFYVVKMS